jgi:hypothetical protein
MGHDLRLRSSSLKLPHHRTQTRRLPPSSRCLQTEAPRDRVRAAIPQFIDPCAHEETANHLPQDPCNSPVFKPGTNHPITSNIPLPPPPDLNRERTVPDLPTPANPDNLPSRISLLQPWVLGEINLLQALN